ncbi:MAG: SpoIID/LytB domain-containing protein, partial [Clostridia bacterium]|nr:SpoIID/LytB domain-containing protein [Clostridia bacterium]
MRKYVAIALALVFVLMYIPTDVAFAASDYDYVRVKLTTNNATSLTVSVSGQYFIEENSKSFSDGTLTITSQDNGNVRVYHSTLGVLYTGSSVSILRCYLDRTRGYLLLNSCYYLGHFTITRTSNGYLQVVNTVPFAHYLYGVVSKEMSNSYPLEALKAQAIAAKGFAINKILAGSSSGYDIGDTASDQVYAGYFPENTRIIEAVDATIDDVLMIGDRVLMTYFSASNGGETNLPSYAWSSGSSNAGYSLQLDPYDFAGSASVLESVFVPTDGSPVSNGALSALLLSKAAAALEVELASLKCVSSISANTPKYPNTLHNMSLITATLIVTTATGDGDSEGDELTVEVSFPVSNLLSAGVFANGSLRIYWGEETDGGYTLYHGRWGHGVGLSQYGARQRALDNQTYAQILAFYYPGTTMGDLNISMPSDPVMPQPTATPISTPTPTQNPDDYVFIGEGVVNANTLNFRTEPSTASEIIRVLSRGETVSIISRVGNWYYAFDYETSRVGYLSALYISFTPTP